MDFLKAQFTRIQEQLSGLTATQKMLVFCLLTIMVMTLMWWSHWAAGLSWRMKISIWCPITA